VRPPLAAWHADEDEIDWGDEPAVGEIDSHAKALSRTVCELWVEQARRAEVELCVESQEEPDLNLLLAHVHALLHLAVVQRDYRKVDALNFIIGELLESYTHRT